MKRKRCRDCRISDILSGGDGRCRVCWGKGTSASKQFREGLVDMLTLELVEDSDSDTDCDNCFGTGQCQTCGGEGYIYVDEEKNVEVESIEDEDDLLGYESSSYSSNDYDGSSYSGEGYYVSSNSEVKPSNSNHMMRYVKPYKVESSNKSSSSNENILKFLCWGFAALFIISYFTGKGTSNKEEEKVNLPIQKFIRIGKTGYVKVGGYANIRSGVSVNYSIVDKLSKGEPVFVIERDVKTNWYRIKYRNNKYGYISNKLITFNREFKILTPLNDKSFLGFWKIDNDNSSYNFYQNRRGVYRNSRGAVIKYRWSYYNNYLKIVLDSDNSVWEWKINSIVGNSINMYSRKNRLNRKITKL